MTHKIFETISILILLSIFTALGNAVSLSIYGTGSTSFTILLMDGLTAMAVLAGISLAGYLIGLLPKFNKLPVILWASIVAAYLSSPYFPYSDLLVQLTNKVSLLVICTPVLAFAGLALGKDLAQFKTISWRIIPVSLAVFTGTFIFAALIAQVTLRWEGVIP